jgi:predicted DsbA family dithiol-disulfide isomerase
MNPLRIDVWSDLACPWCFVGKRRLEAALKLVKIEVAPQIVWRSFELDSNAPAVVDSSRSYAERLATKYRRTVPQAQAMIDNMTQTAALDGIAMKFDLVRAGNTFDAHRLLHLAASHGLQDRLKERLFTAYLSQGEALGDHATLQRLAVEVGLDAADVAGVLASNTHADDVRADEAMAKELEISGVPFFVIGGRVAVSGAQSAEALADAIRQALAAESTPAGDAANGAHCAVNGCD